MRPLQLGKLPIGVLNRTVLKMTGAPSKMVFTPAKAGIDFAAVRVGRMYMIVSADPITGVVEDIGRYAMCVSANDVATSGCRPEFAESVVLLPEGSDERYVEGIARQMHLEARRRGISIVGGHTEVTPGLARPIVVVTAFGFAQRYVSSADARPGDVLMVTKTAGLEGTAVLTGARRVLSRISIVEEAVAAYRTGFVHAMHDCTEGGVIGAAFEMSLASGLGFLLRRGDVPVSPRTRDVCSRLRLDPLKLIGSGALLLAVQPGKEEAVSKALLPICRAKAVGVFTRKGRALVWPDGRRQRILSAPEDELWRASARPR
jgi:hydrogenase maturation factor